MRCEPQFDLLTSFHQGNKSINEWYNAVQAQENLTKYPPETVKNTTSRHPSGSSYA